MENIRRKIKLFFVYYGELLTFFIGITIAIIFVIQWLNNLAIKNKEELYSSEEYRQEVQQAEDSELEKKTINQFIQYCNEQKIKEAYEMLSDSCKSKKFSTVDIFKEEYINKKFNIKICDYEINKQEDNTYIISLIEDMIVTGKTNSSKETIYKIEGILKNEINIVS